ncbi:MAG: hypothetical protein ACYDEO_05020 [Aggregatilineales bacterium]
MSATAGHGARWAVLLAVLTVGLAACGADAEPLVPTARPTPTITPTRTLTTSTPTDLSTPPTIITLLHTATPGPSPTPLIGPTSTQIDLTPSPTLPPLPAAPGSLNIEYFTTDAQNVHAGDTLTLYWSITGADHAVIYRMNADGTHDQFWQVGRSGSLIVSTRPADTNTVRFGITVGDSLNRLDQTLTVSIGCASTQWFFSPAPAGCPAAPPQFSPAAQESFERGQMIWIGNQGRIYVLFNDNKKPGWAVYADAFKDGQPDRDPSLAPPPNLSQPIRGFGLVWRTQPHVRDRLGWATGPELGFDGVYQSDSVAVPNTVLYMRSRDKNIFQMSGKDQSWKLIVPLVTPTPKP